MNEVSCQHCQFFEPYIKGNWQGGGKCQKIEDYKGRGATEVQVNKRIREDLDGVESYPFFYGCSFRKCTKFLQRFASKPEV